MSFVFAPPAQAVLPVRGTDAAFPIHRVYCVGRNYAAHAVEMGGDPNAAPPFFFQKNPDNVVPPGGAFPYPSKTNDVHHEVELVIALGAGGDDIPAANALAHIFGYAVGIDMTRRDLQAEAKDLSRPWATAKAFEYSAPCSEIVPASAIGHPTEGAITLEIDGERRQTGDINQMIWKTPEIVAYLSGLFTLAPGDLIYTGTPAGVGPVQRGQTMTAHIAGLADLRVSVT